jgi:hypothetical protein
MENLVEYLFWILVAVLGCVALCTTFFYEKPIDKQPPKKRTVRTKKPRLKTGENRRGGGRRGS